MQKFRILERRTNGDWTPFGVAYERDGRVVLFALPWWADRTLAATSLEELDARHCPSTEFQWRAVETADAPQQHPIAWLQRALNAPSAVETHAVLPGTVHTPHGVVPVEVRVGKGVGLAAGLRRLEATWQDLPARLTAWREQVERGDVAAEVAVRAVLTTERTGRVEVEPTLSHPSVQFAYADPGLRGERSEDPRTEQATSAVIVRTDALPGARVAIEGDTIGVTFLDWQSLSPPLVVLVPEDNQGTPRMPDVTESAGGVWTVRFERVPSGASLLAVAPTSS